MLKTFIAVFLFLIAIFVVVGMCVNPVSNAPAAQSAQKTPAEQKQIAKDESNLNRAIVGAQSLRAAMRNPDSFKLASVHVKTTGAVCYSFRAQNGFGGMNLEYAVLAPGAKGLNQNASAWNSQCAHIPGDDRTAEVVAHLGGL